MLPKYWLVLQSLFTLTACADSPAPIFRPQSGGIFSAGVAGLPLPYNLSATHTIYDPSSSSPGSYWISAFIHASNNHDYLVISNLAANLPLGAALYRASILDITNLSRYSQYERVVILSDIYNSHGVLNATFHDSGFGSINPTDPISTLRTYSKVPGTQFDLTFETSSPALLNGGLGTFQVDGKPAFQWSMPAGKTTGWILVDGKKVDVISDKSQTWYDRQWGSIPSRFAWFQVHLSGDKADGSEDEIFSIWTLHDNKVGDRSFATIRVGTSAQQRVVPVSWKVSSDRTFKSPTSGVTWPLDWSIQIQEGPEFQLSSIRPDQEATGLLKSYTGFLDVTATYPGGQKVSGYGVVEAIVT
ncbi:Kievitone hydratase [Cladobotryum mycophilum]|uniref:Kievitone hydratase n=1 Tax=Cladobotryum mycophilum TaxID=491253 RepID=A0ABR0SNR7_9HYPO